MGMGAMIQKHAPDSPAARRMQPFDPFEDVERAQDLSREGVEAIGEQLRPELMRDIGDAIGGLNSIGALRSGGTTVALRDLTQTYADRIGTAASAATLGAINTGMGASGMRLQDRQIRNQENEARRAREAALWRSIGTVLGAGVGFAVGGPAGAAVGAGAGSGGG